MKNLLIVRIIFLAFFINASSPTIHSEISDWDISHWDIPESWISFDMNKVILGLCALNTYLLYKCYKKNLDLKQVRAKNEQLAMFKDQFMILGNNQYATRGIYNQLQAMEKELAEYTKTYYIPMELMSHTSKIIEKLESLSQENNHLKLRLMESSKVIKLLSISLPEEHSKLKSLNAALVKNFPQQIVLNSDWPNTKWNFESKEKIKEDLKKLTYSFSRCNEFDRYEGIKISFIKSTKPLLLTD